MRRTRKYRFACSLARHLKLSMRGRDAEHAVLYSNLERRGYTWDPKMAKAGGWFREAERDPPTLPAPKVAPLASNEVTPYPCATCQTTPILARGVVPVCPRCRTKVCRDCGKALPNGRIYVVCRACQRRKSRRTPTPTPTPAPTLAPSSAPVEHDLAARLAVMEGRMHRLESEVASLRLLVSGKQLGGDLGELGTLFNIDMEGAPGAE